jgi:hypothetical protein
MVISSAQWHGHRISNAVLQTDIFISAVVRLAAWQGKRNEGRRVNMPEKKGGESKRRVR